MVPSNLGNENCRGNPTIQFLKLRRERWDARQILLEIERHTLIRVFRAWKDKRRRKRCNLPIELNACDSSHPAIIKRTQIMSNVSKTLHSNPPKWRCITWTGHIETYIRSVSKDNACDVDSGQDKANKEPLILAIDKGNKFFLSNLLCCYTPDSLPTCAWRKGLSSVFPEIVEIMLIFASTDQTNVSKKNLSQILNMSVSGCDLNHSFLHQAAHRGNVETIKLLVSYGAEINKKNAFDRTPLHLACATARYWGGIRSRNTSRQIYSDKSLSFSSLSHSVCALLSLGSNPNSIDCNGETPLYEACRSFDEYSIRVLLNSGASPLLVSNNSKMCFEVVKHEHRSRVLAIIKSSLQQIGCSETFSRMIARFTAHQTWTSIVGQFDKICKRCGQKVSTCERIKSSSFSHWLYSHQ